MIEIERAEQFRHCNVCNSKNDIYNLIFRYEGTNSGTQVALCNNCLNELSDKIHLITKPQSERQKGKWKLLTNGDAICSVCGFTQKHAWDFDNWDNYCHHCGSDNR